MGVTRVLSFAGRSVRLEAEGPNGSALVSFLFGRIPGDAAPTRVEATFTVRDSERGIRFTVDGETWFDGPDEETAGSLIVEEVMHRLMLRSDAGLLLHAAALARQGKGVLLPGESGSGKSTTAAWLASQGWDYLTDELVFVPAGTTGFRAFARPIQLRAGSRPALADNAPAGDVRRGTAIDLLEPAAMTVTAGEQVVPLSLIVFPRHGATADCELVPLSGARAGLDLMRALLNARNLPDHGFAHVSQLVRSVRAVQLLYSEIRALGARLDALLE